MNLFYTAVTLVIAMAAGYLLGSVNWSIILTKLFRRKDIRDMGSGNAGMTNVLRTVGKGPAALTFVGDFLKGIVSALIAWFLVWCCGVWLTGEYSPEIACVARCLAGSACVVGHIYPAFYQLRGGKGVATAAAVILMTDWKVFLAAILTFGLVFLAKKIVSLASVACAGLYPVYTLISVLVFGFMGNHSLGYLLFAVLQSGFVGGLVLYKHKANIGRLLRGEEKPITTNKSKS